MPFDWKSSPQLPEPTPPFTIPSDALTSKQALVANTVSYGGALSYNTSTSSFDVVYEEAALNVVILQITSGSIDTNATANASIVNQQYALSAIANAVANIAPSTGGGGGLDQDFRGLKLRADPDQNAAKRLDRIKLLKADEIVMHDGVSTNTGWVNMTANVFTSGANGLSYGTVANNTWYEIHAIRNKANGRQGLIFNKADNVHMDDQNEFVTNFRREILRRTTAISGSDNTKLGESFIPTANGRLASVTLYMGSQSGGGLAGTYWVTLEADSGGSPSNTPLATSRVHYARLVGQNGIAIGTVKFIFDLPATLTGGQTYWLVLQGTTTRSNSLAGSIYWLGRRAPPNNPLYAGVLKRFDSGSSTWVATVDSGTGIVSTLFQTWMRYDYSPLANNMPAGYNQRAHLGFVYYNELAPISNRPGLTYFSQVQRSIWFGSPSVDGTFITKDPTNNFSIIEIDLSRLVPPVPVMCWVQVQQDPTLGYTNQLVWAPAEDIASDVEVSLFVGPGTALTICPIGGYAIAEFPVEQSSILVDSQATPSQPDTVWVTKVEF